MSDQAKHAIRAAQNRSRWGKYAARTYCLRRGVPLALYRLACQLNAADAKGVDLAEGKAVNA